MTQIIVPADAIGYMGIYSTKLDRFDGMYVLDNERMKPAVIKAQMAAMMSPVNAVGALSATVADMWLRSDRENDYALSVMMRALTALNKDRFFTLSVDVQPHGTYTSIDTMSARDFDAARDEFNNHPDVLEIKERIIKSEYDISQGRKALS